MSQRGTVDRYDRKRGFGSIAREDGTKIFVHWKSIVSQDDWPSLKSGMEVLFDVGTDDGRRSETKEVAQNVTDVDGNPIAVVNEVQAKNLSRQTTTGTVKFFSSRGFGFITIDTPIRWPAKLPAGTDVYVSREDFICQEGTIYTLKPGHRVQFRAYTDTVSEEKRCRAGAVQNEDGTPLNFGDAAEATANRLVGKKASGKKGDKSKGKGESKSKPVGQATGTVTTYTPVKTFPAGVGLRPGSTGVTKVIKTMVKTTTTRPVTAKGKSKGK